MFSPHHCGLYFDEDRIAFVRQQRKRAPIQAAWDYLLAAEPETNLAQVQISALRYRFNADLAAGQEAATILRAIALPMKPRELLVLVQSYELIRDHEGVPPSFIPSLRQIIEALPNHDEVSDLVDLVWLAALHAAAGIVLDDGALFDGAISVYRQVIQQEIHPEGYLPAAVELYPELVSLRRQLEVVQAMVLIAAMGEAAGINLWQVEQRGVSILTATSYPLYYYFYPEKWPWNEDKWKPSNGIELEQAQQAFRAHAGFLEIVNLKYDRPLRAINLILAQLRPIYDVYGGGLTTLTHAPPTKQGLFR